MRDQIAHEAFVICQVGAEGSETRERADEIFGFVVEPVVKEFDLRPTRSDRDPTPGQVTAQIVRSLTSARVIIADLTGRNPNVYYELGVAHSFAKPVVILVDTVESLSFDTSHERVIELGEGDRLGVADAEKAKKKLREVLKVVLDEEYRPASLVTEAAGTQSLQALAPDNPIATELAYVRDRLELVVQQTSRRGSTHDAELRRDAAILFDLITLLGQEGNLTTRDLRQVGFDPAEHAISDSLKEALARAIPEPSVDDDIPF